MKSSRVLLVKIGNSQISFCLNRGNSKPRHLPSHFDSLERLARSASIPKVWIVASVNRSLNQKLKSIAVKRGVEVLFVKASDLKIRQPYRKGLGIDRLLNVFAGTQMSSKSFVLIDLGTATTVEFYCRKKGYLGGWIASGLQTSLNGLALQAPALPRIELKSTGSTKNLTAGRSTKDCLIKGAEASTLGLIEFARRRAPAILNTTSLEVILTGGWSARFKSELRFKFKYEPNLLLKALGSLAERRYTKGA